MSPQSYADLSLDELRSMFDYLFVGQPAMTRHTFRRFQQQIIALQQSWNHITHAERTAQSMNLVAEATHSANAPKLAQRLMTGQYVSQDGEFQAVERDSTRPRDRTYLTRARCAQLRREREAAEREGRPTTPPPGDAQDDTDVAPTGEPDCNAPQSSANTIQEPIDSPMQPSTPTAPRKETTSMGGNGNDLTPSSSDSGYITREEHDHMAGQITEALEDRIKHLELVEEQQRQEIARHKHTISQQEMMIANLQQENEEERQRTRHMKDRLAEIKRKTRGACDEDDEQADKY